MALDEVQGMGYDHRKNYPEDIKNVIVKNINPAAKEYFIPGVDNSRTGTEILKSKW
ncbi:hypothetical protein ACFL6W_02405 [Thermodesulfobacteriota bacterium]